MKSSGSNLSIKHSQNYEAKETSGKHENQLYQQQVALEDARRQLEESKMSTATMDDTLKRSITNLATFKLEVSDSESKECALLGEKKSDADSWRAATNTLEALVSTLTEIIEMTAKLAGNLKFITEDEARVGQRTSHLWNQQTIKYSAHLEQQFMDCALTKHQDLATTLKSTQKDKEAKFVVIENNEAERLEALETKKNEVVETKQSSCKKGKETRKRSTMAYKDAATKKVKVLRDVAQQQKIEAAQFRINNATTTLETLE